LCSLGEYVVGGELSLDRLTSDDAEGDSDLQRLRGIAGYDLGRFMPYATLGLARFSDEDVSETGVTFGLGAEYRVTDNFGVGLEFSRSNFSDVDDVDGVDIDVDMIQLRTSFHF
jgi:outer membrane immunogenic protein